MRPRRHLLLFLALTGACSGSEPGDSGDLIVTVSGLPSSVPASVSVSGPGGFARALTGSQHLTGLNAGSYTVAADLVSGGGASYQPAPALQTLTVTEGSSPAAATVSYAVWGGSLTVTIAGLPSGGAGSVTVSGPGAFERRLTASTTLSGLTAGLYTLAAQSVAVSAEQYDPTPPVANITVAAGASTAATITYAPGSSAGLNLRIAGMHLTQSVQTFTGTVPLVKDRDGYLRVFVTANGPNVATPSVRVRFYLNGAVASEVTIPAPASSVPLSSSQASLTSSWNIPVPKGLIRPSLAILAEVDPGNAVAEGVETDNVFPASGTPLPMDVRTTSTFAVRFVPVRQAGGFQGDVSNANMASYLVSTMRMHPLASYDADLRAPYTTSAPRVEADNDNGAWSTILSEINSLRLADPPSGRHYFGVLNTPYGSGVAGIGYVGGSAALGWDRPGADLVAAHEWGHNWGRLHAPCNDPPNPDPSYPYANGVIGVYGFDVVTGSLKPSSYHDVMGYCNDEWISDYTYGAVLSYRAAHPDVVSAFSQASQPCLLVWGRIVDGQPVLEPAFEVIARPALPARSGRYSLEGRAADGGELFRLSFTPDTVADDPRGGQQFAFAIPLASERSSRLALIRLAVPGGESTRQATPSLRAPLPEARRTGPGRVSVRWNSARHPMVMVRDPGTGMVLSFARGGRSEVVTDRDDLELQVSDGVRSEGRRVRVTR
jgi:hypothetical protein